MRLFSPCFTQHSWRIWTPYIENSTPHNTYCGYIIVGFGKMKRMRNHIPTWRKNILVSAWWRHQMKTFYALLAICAGNSPVTGEFPSQRVVTRNFDIFFDLRLNKRLSKQSRCRWFETPSRSLWRHGNDETNSAHELLMETVSKRLRALNCNIS